MPWQAHVAALATGSWVASMACRKSARDDLHEGVAANCGVDGITQGGQSGDAVRRLGGLMDLSRDNIPPNSDEITMAIAEAVGETFLRFPEVTPTLAFSSLCRVLSAYICLNAVEGRALDLADNLMIQVIKPEIENMVQKRCNS